MASTVPEEIRRSHGMAARLGTASHAVIEHCLKKGLTPEDLRDRIVMVMEKDDEDGASILREGAKMPKPGADQYPFIVDDDMIDDCDVAVDYVRARLEELGIPEDKLQLETKTNPIPDNEDTAGTADITIPAWPVVLEVDDYKNGYLLVEAEDNDQARAYLAGKAIESDWSYETYRAGIIQPNSPHADGPVRIIEYTESELKAFVKDYDKSIKKCEKAEAEFDDLQLNIDDLQDGAGKDWAKKWLKAGDHCTFCEAGATCPVRRMYAEDAARIEFADPPSESRLPVVSNQSREVGGSAEEQVGRILAWAPILDDLVRSAKLYAHRAMEAGYEIPGQKLVAARSNRKLNEDLTPKTLPKLLIEGGFITNADADKLFHARKLKSGPQIEKIIKKKMRKEFNKDFLTKPDNGTSVAPIDDPRPSVEPRDISEDFETEEPDFG